MIATGLTFLLGVLVTTLVAILVAPLVWRKAQHLARRDYAATIPATANEIRAEFDRVRAEAALSVRRQEVVTAKALEKSARTQAELGRGTVENVELIKRVRSLEDRIAQRETELAETVAALASQVAETERLTGALSESRHEATLTGEELEALAGRFQELGDIAEERKIELIAAEAKIDRLADSNRTAERGEREAREVIERLRAELAAALRAVAQEKKDATELSQRLDQMAADLADREEEVAALKARLAGAVPIVGVASGKRLPAAGAAPQVAARTETAGQRLRAAIDKRNGSEASPANATELRETISDLAARVIRMTALTEGPASPLGGMLAGTGGTAPGGTPSLAERVRRLAEAEQRATPAAASQPPEARPE